MLKANKYRFSEVPQRYWDFVQRHGSIYQTKPYVECMMASGKDIIIIEIEDNGVVVGGSYVARLRKVFNIPIIASTFFGPVIGDIQRYDEVFHCYTKAVKKASLVFALALHPYYIEAFKASRDFSRWGRKDFQILHWDISGSVEDIIKQLPKRKRRYVVSQTRKEGIIVEEIKTEQQIKQAYELHCESMYRGGLKPAPYCIYKNLFNMLRPKNLAAGFLALHPHTKKPIATAMLLLGMHSEAIHLAIGYDREFQNLHASDLLMLHCVNFLKSKGFTLFNMVGMPLGDSPRAKGIQYFKLAWAGDKGQVHNSYILTGGFLGAGYKTVKAVLKKLFILRDMVFFLGRKSATEAGNNGGDEDS